MDISLLSTTPICWQKNDTGYSAQLPEAGHSQAGSPGLEVTGATERASARGLFTTLICWQENDAGFPRPSRGPAQLRTRSGRMFLIAAASSLMVASGEVWSSNPKQRSLLQPQTTVRRP
jgi:hypothetical protein